MRRAERHMPACDSGRQQDGRGDLANRRSSRAVLLCSIVAVCVVAFLSLFLGNYSLDVSTVVGILLSPLGVVEQTWDSTDVTVVYEVRLPRILAAIVVGAALSVSGATYQSVFKNPLVSPDLLGVSAGACVGAAIAILAHIGAVAVGASALVGGLVAVACAVGLAGLFRNGSSLILVLSGVIVSGFMNSALGLIKYIADPETELPSITYWQLGSVADTRLDDLGFVMIPMLVCFVVTILLRWRIGMLGLGDEEAALLGVNVKRLRLVSIVCSTTLTACAVCISGTIGWIGLVVPHLCRFLVGSDSAKVIPLSMTVGALFLLVIDTIARTVTTVDVPLSILIGFIGTPLFVWLILRQKGIIR